MLESPINWRARPPYGESVRIWRQARNVAPLEPVREARHPYNNLRSWEGVRN